MTSTVAETSNYLSTSRYEDVMNFIAAIQQGDPDLRVETFGTTNEGRALPLVIAGPPGVVDPASARATGLPVIFVMANIHAGEVEGKEAAQMLLRDLTLGPLRPLLDSIILLVVPIYNADGNEALAPQEINRPEQNGPPRVGRRANGQGLDLNRDYVKLEAPETRASEDLLDRWNPDLFIDLHTTDATGCPRAHAH